MKTRVVQLTPTVNFGDAVSNDVFAMQDVLTSLGFENHIYAIGIAEKVRNRVKSVSQYKSQPSDIILYHMSIGSDLSKLVQNANVHRKLMVYHNITPGEFFHGLRHVEKGCVDGRCELKALAPHIDYAFADSDYNKEELDSLGYQRTQTLPIIFDKSDFIRTVPNKHVLEKYSNDGYTNILFVGRLAPNKRQEDVIKSFHLYNKYINPKSRLFLVGSAAAMEDYYFSLEQLIEQLDVKNVIFPGHISFSEIIAYYKLADVFLCMSEHEGFCVPLLEAMIFDVPIIAYASSAIPDTLGGCGVLLKDKEYPLVAEMIHEVVSNKDLRRSLIEKQRKRLDYFDYEKTKSKFGAYVLPLLGE